MNKALALLFTFIYILLAYFLAVLGSIHGSSLYPYFELSFLVIALSVLWWLCFWIPPRQPHGLATLTLCGVGVGALLALASFASRRPLIDWDVRQMQKRAAATEVFNMRDEILLWQGRAPIGIRLSYSLRFPDNDYYWQSPFVYPQRDLGYSVGWNIVQETIDPAMQIVAPGADVVPIETAHEPPAVRRYEKRKLYNFPVDLVPDFIALSSDGSKLCVVRPPARNPALEKLLTGENNSFYTITVSETNYKGLTQTVSTRLSFFLFLLLFFFLRAELQFSTKNSR